MHPLSVLPQWHSKARPSARSVHPASWFAALALTTSPALALAGGTTYTVTEGQSIQAAIDQAASGDCILVEPGCYTGSLNLGFGKDLEILSTDGPHVTIIHGQSNLSVVTIAGGQTNATRFSGFTIQDGGGQYGVIVDPVGETVTPVVDANEPRYGGGFYIEDSSPVIENNIIQLNRVRGKIGVDGYFPAYGGGLYATGNYFDEGAAQTLQVRGCLVRQNAVEFVRTLPGFPLPRGGGMYLDNCVASLVDNRVGPGTDETQEETLIELTIPMYPGPDQPGFGNSAVQGGGIAISDGQVFMDRNVIVGNTAHEGGGIFLETKGMVGEFHSLARSQVFGNQIHDLEVDDSFGQFLIGEGAGLYVAGDDDSQVDVVVRSSVLGRNGTEVRDAVGPFSASVQCGRGGAAFMDDDAVVWFDFCTIIENASLLANGGGIGGEALFFDSGPWSGLNLVRSSIVWHSVGGDITSGPAVTYCNVEDSSFNFGTNMSAAPQFVDESDGDYHLAASDPGIDQGDPALPFPFEPDFDGGELFAPVNARVLNGAPDIGADERGIALYSWPRHDLEALTPIQGAFNVRVTDDVPSDFEFLLVSVDDQIVDPPRQLSWLQGDWWLTNMAMTTSPYFFDGPGTDGYFSVLASLPASLGYDPAYVQAILVRSEGEETVQVATNLLVLLPHQTPPDCED